ncbi:autotransporter outer membrane beta-barrel domain-containing protein [Variovorax sp. KBW07]|uniref:autotransporter outer membrane beta-barrel domain-containing protein n=1 Tax=Variovorax sp. KBW07 TaxID=2153358 RepID=UPI0016236C78|nr:autotransporter outer membrane beta-barrel domain-containing protein [Variovorax sp. KBW07]
MKNSKTIRVPVSVRRKKLKSSISLTVLAIASACAAAQSPEPQGRYFNADGTRTNDLEAAAKTWRTPEFLLDHALPDVKAEYAYAYGFTGKGIKIGMVDSGAFAGHPQLQGQYTPLVVQGVYGLDGAQLDDSGKTWKKGDKFSTFGNYDPLINDSHGTAAAGEMVAKRDATGDPAKDKMHGIAFDAHLYSSNSGGTDDSVYGPDVDYEYFKEAYGVLSRNGARVVNSSWGQESATAGDYGTLAGTIRLHSTFAGKKTFLDAAAEVSQQYGTIQVWANGNEGRDNPRAVSTLPYFRPEIEKYWITVTGVTKDDRTVYDRCGIAKYWCMAGPTVEITTTSVGLNGGDNDYDYGHHTPEELAKKPPQAAYSPTYNGTSAAAPNVTASLALLMQRFPYLGDSEARDVLFTTAKHLGDGPADVPNATFGWGKPDMQKGMNGPGQFLGTFNAKLLEGMSDTWSNNISEAALIQRKKEETAEIAAWSDTKAGLLRQLEPFPEATAPSDEFVAAISRGKALLLAAIIANTRGVYTAETLKAALDAVNADPVGKQLLQTYESYKPGWTGPYSQTTDFDNFIAGRNDLALAKYVANVLRTAIQSQIASGESRIAYLQTRTNADYAGGLVKMGLGTLVLTGANTYSGGTRLEGGTLGVGHASALGTGTLAMSDATTLQAVADKLTLANAITVSGIGNIDTQAFGLTLSGAITDGSTPGGFAKLGTGTLTLSGANTYSGPTGVINGTLRAGSATGFSARSAFFVDTQGQLDLASANQTIGSLSGAGKVALGTATLTTGADNSSTAFSGQIAGSGGVAKTGSGTFTLASANTYTGGTALKAGQLNVGDNNALGTGALSMDDGTTLGFSADGLNVVNSVKLTGTQDPVIDTGAFSETLSGVISGTGFLTKNGSGVLTTTGANTYSGATIVAAGTLQAGAVNAFSATSAMTVNTGATLNLAGYNQRIGGMNLAGTVVVSGTPPGTVLTVAGPWVGSGGLLKLGTVSPSVSDRVLLSGTNAVASGLTTVQVGNFVGLGGATVGNGIELIGTTGGASIQGNAFALAGGHVDVGAYEYRLNNIGSGGYLSSSSPKGQTYYRSEVPQYAALPAQLRQASLAMLGNMHQRAGDDDVKTTNSAPSEGSNGSDSNSRRAWGRVISANLNIRQSGTVSPQSHGRLDGFQAGTDLLSVRNWRAGVYVGQLDGEMGVSGSVRGVQNLHVGGSSLHNQYLGAYGTYASDNGLYADAVLQSGRHSYSFVNPLTQSGSAGAGKGQSLLASVEVGQSFELGGTGNWKVEPQLQLTHQRLSLDDATLAGGTQVRQHPDSAWLARLGVRVKGEVGMGAGRLQPYARFNLYRASNGSDVASFSASGARTAIASSTGGTSAELAAGATLALTPTFGLYGEIGKLWSAGGNTRVKSSLQGSAGARVLW